MKFYIIVEGKCDRYLYIKWLEKFRPDLTHESDYRNLYQNSYYIIDGGGYPNYLKIIENAIQDINAGGFCDRLVISVDSEELGYAAKKTEMENYINNLAPIPPYYLIVQNHCIESWALANTKIFARKPINQDLIDLINHHSVLNHDPEQLSPLPTTELNRAQTAVKYLTLLLREKHNRVTYVKSRPIHVAHPKYFDEILVRHNTTEHIPSFKDFITAFS